jgi:hypothetical protein
MTSDEMRERARQCWAQVETALDKHSRAVLIVAAHIWEALAEQHDNLGALDTSPDKATNDK